MPGFAPMGGTPLGALALEGGGGGAGTNYENLIDGLTFAGSSAGLAMAMLYDGIEAGDMPVSTLINNLIDGISFANLWSPRRDRFVSQTSEIAFQEALALGWSVALAENIALAGTAAAGLGKVGALVDTLHAAGVVATRLDALALVIEVISINTLLTSGWSMEAVDTVGFQDALAAQIGAITAMVSTAAFVGTAEPSLRVTVLMADTIAADTDLATQLSAYEALGDGVVFYTTLRLGDGEYTGWVMNEGAASEYRNYPFNGFTRFDATKKYYGTSDEGLFLLEGEDDAGEPIEAWVKTALMDFGTGKLKKVPDVYVGFIGGNALLLKVVITDKGKQTEHQYRTTMPAGPDLHPGRFEVGRGLESRYWQFEIRNIDGAEFELDDIVWRPIMLDRRI